MAVCIQVSYQQLESLQKLLDSYPQLTLEVVDFAYPSNYGLEGEQLVELWKEHPLVDRVESLFGSYYDLYLHSIDPQIAQISRKRYLWNLGLADQLDAATTVFHTNFQHERQSSRYLKQWIEAHDRFVQQVDQTYTSQVCWINGSERSAKVFQLLADHSSSTPVFALDLKAVAEFSKTPLSSWVEDLGASISRIYLGDENDTEEAVVLGQGKLNSSIVEEVCHQLAGTTIVLPVQPLGIVEQNLQLLQDWDLM